MNNARRKAIDTIIAKLEGSKTELETLREEIEMLKDEEQDYYDGMPESIQGGDKGAAAEGAVTEFDNAIDAIGGMIDEIENVTSPLESARDGA